MSIAFRQRAASSLTHPVTVAALATLLLNDIVLKRLWPGEWVTGKLSDLVWMVFVPPLLAYLLSLTVLRRNHPGAERTVFATAYVGLPLLYVAFNTFEPVHDFILSGLSLVGGGRAGSPLDATDSLVIPLAMAIAFWVWNRTPVHAGTVRARLVLLTAALAMIASVATSYPPPHLGIIAVTRQVDGAIHAVSGEDAPLLFESVDGGFTWRVIGPSRAGYHQNRTVQTPTAWYSINGVDIVYSDHNGSKVVYSADYLSEAGNLTLQEIRTSDIEYRIATTAPYSITYDPDSGNIVVAMGLQGVVVGTPHGEWKRVRVGRYEPTDFSFIGRILPLWDWRFAVTALVIAVSFTALGQAWGLRRPAEGSTGARFVRVEIIVLACLTVILAIPFLGFIILLLCLPLVPLLLWVLLGSPKQLDSRLTIFLATLGAMAAILSLLAFASYPQDPTDTANFRSLWLPLTGFALIAGLSVAAVNLPTLGRLWVVGTTLAGIFILTSLSSVLWTQQGLGFWFTLVSTVVLATLVAVALSRYLAHTRSAEAEYSN